ncbi:MAG: PorT family protein [Porphyromonadaceae bacterium]|jgi:hypothetical protein|nr:PorT family protein [Porphyromonadaceae bacterium]
MKFIKIAVTITVLVLLFASCSTYNGLTRNENHSQTQVVLSEKNYKIVKYVEGDAYARYVLAFGGKSKRGLLARARENMLRNAGLIGASRAVINETVETRVRQSLFVTEVWYIVSAYVVEFYDPESELPPAAEESVYSDADYHPRTPNVWQSGLTAGVTLQADRSESNFQYTHTPGVHLGYKMEFSNPDIKYLFWATQLNLSYLNENITNMNQPHSTEKTLGIEIPFLVGIKYPIVNEFKWFLSGGPTVGALFNVYKSSTEENEGYPSYPSIGAELYSGFHLGNHWQLGFGHRWNISYYEFDYSKISLSYMF